MDTIHKTEKITEILIKNGKSQIITGDTLTTLKKIPDNSIDLGITSPPYNKQERNKGWLVNSVLYDAYPDKVPEVQYQLNQVVVLNEIFRITSPGGSFFYNHKLRWDKGILYHPVDWIRKSKWVFKQGTKKTG